SLLRSFRTSVSIEPSLAKGPSLARKRPGVRTGYGEAIQSIDDREVVERANVGRRGASGVGIRPARRCAAGPLRWQRTSRAQSAPARSVYVSLASGLRTLPGAWWKLMLSELYVLHRTTLTSRVNARSGRSRYMAPAEMMSGSVMAAVPPWSGSEGSNSGLGL